MRPPALFDEDPAPGADAPGRGAIAAIVESVAADHGHAPDRLIEILHDVQHVLGWIPREAVPEIARRLNLSRADVHGVLTFYDDFRAAPPPRHVLRVCGAEACQAAGAEAVLARLASAHGLAPGERSACGRLGLEVVHCLGNCALGPAGEMDGAPLARLDGARVDALVGAALSGAQGAEDAA